MKSNERPDKRLHIRKKVAGGATGAVVGAAVAGPVGALVGGVVGTLVGSAAEKQSLTLPSADNKSHQLRAKGKSRMKRAAKKTSKPSKRRSSSHGR